MNIELIKSETESHFRSEGDEGLFEIKLQKAKSDIAVRFQKWKAENPGKDFSEFRTHAVDEVRSGMQYLDEILNVGIFLTALDQAASWYE